MHSKKKDLPIGVQSFKRLIEEDFIYIDKTNYIHELISKGKYYFLSRPRRFGRTLLCSTLEELFLGNEKLFTSLAISATGYSWEKYPVIYISFVTMAHGSATVLRASVDHTIRKIAQEHGVEIDESEPSLGVRFKSLILNLATKNKVVILIDEYDAPLLKNVDNLKEAEASSQVLSEFYSALYDEEVDDCLRFVFISGVSKFSKTSIFSGLSALQDLSLDPRAALLLGFTEEEIRIYLKEYLERISQKKGRSLEEILHKMRYWYNGYQFVDPDTIDNPRVYNPYSVLLYLETQVFRNYWFETGTPTFLMKLLKRLDFPLIPIDGAIINERDIQSYDIADIKLVPLLWQTGYLTIESYDPATMNYTLTFPNEEVRFSFYEYVMKELAKNTLDRLLTQAFRSN